MRTPRLLLTAILLSLLPLCAHAAEISPAGKKLADFLDGMNVEKLWLAGSPVHWKTGEPIGEPAAPPEGPGHTHCSAFVAAVCLRKDIYILRPPEHSTVLLASAQHDWLAEHGKEKGWRPVENMAEAQSLANQGHLVVTVFKASDPDKPGHAAIVRPSDKPDDQLQQEGPQVIQAGRTNYRSVSMKEGFKHHPTAWKDGQVAFYVHELKWD